jgi:TonB family protein
MSGKVGSPIEKQIDLADGKHVTIKVMLRGSSVGFRVDIAKGDVMIDSIQSAGATQPMFSPFAAVGPPYRVGGDVTLPILLNRVEPVYPAVARKARIAGIVIIEAIIDRAGVVKDARVLKPLPFGLDQAAIDAVRQWKFRPGRYHGKPVDVIFDLTVNFRLPEPPPPPPPQ